MTGMTDFEKLLYQELREIRTTLGDLRKDLAVHKVKSGFWGSIGGAVTIGVALAVDYFRGGR